MSSNISNENEGTLKYTRAPISGFIVFDVSEEELNSLEAGNNTIAVCSNAFFGVLSMLLTVLVSLFTTQMSDRVFACFLAATVAFIILALFFAILWFINYKKKNETVKIIRNRKVKPNMVSHDEESVQREDFEDSNSDSFEVTTNKM